jgi:hypothetical protein
VKRLFFLAEKVIRKAYDAADGQERENLNAALEAMRSIWDVLRYAGWLHPSDCPPGRYVTAMGGELWRLAEEGVEGWQRFVVEVGEWVDETPTVKVHRIPEERGL